MKLKIVIFLLLVSCFSSFASVVCDSVSCYQLKSDVSDFYDELSLNLGYARNAANNVANNASFALANVRAANTGGNDSNLNSADTKLQSVVSQVGNASSYITFASQYASVMYNFVDSIDCTACENGQCLDPSLLTNIFLCVSNIVDVSISFLGSISNLSDTVSSFYGSSTNYYDSSLYSLAMVTNRINTLTLQVSSFSRTFDDFYESFDYNWEMLIEGLSSIYDEMNTISSYVWRLVRSVEQYLPYVKTISDDLKLLVTNGTFQADYDFTNQLFSSSLLGFDRFRYYAQGQANNNQLQLYPLSPYDTASNLRNATIYDALSSGFASLLISQGSINNYLYWLKAMAGSNRLEAVEAHLVAVSNLVGRLDDYVLGDFSNEVSRLVESLSYVTNRVDYTTNLVEIASLLQTSTNHLSSIDSKLDVLDYIKVLSDTPLSDFSGGSYYDYLTNLYLNGASSSAPSTNWFERIEILLASMVFGDSASSSISNEVEFTNFSEETIENAFNDYTFQNELNSGIDLVENTGGNFLTILRGFHNAIASVSQPQSIAIGLGGLDGQDTTTYEDVMHGHFQVSFNSGEVDSFTLIVRSMTTIIWILITMMFVYFSARWLLSKVLFFYRLMRTLISSLFLK